MVKSVLVVGGGSAGFLAALTLRAKCPDLAITVVRSKEIGVIGVGESTTVAIPRALHGDLNLEPGAFYRAVLPSWKLGIHFLWGPHPYFNYTFDWHIDWKWKELHRHNGFYCDDDITHLNLLSALMTHNRAFARQQDGTPYIISNFGYHLENRRFVAFLEAVAPQRGIEVIDDVVESASFNEQGISGVHLASGRSLTADFYFDCSGFRSLLLGGALKEPFIPFKSTLFNNRALVGSWMRTDEIIKPYTTAETMNAGWCWQIDHPDCINRGYVYSTDFISDEEAEREFRSKNPKVESTNIVKFVSGRYERSWVGNVVAIGNSSGFVEPLESTALAVICDMSRIFAESLRQCDYQPTPLMTMHFNRLATRAWDSIRDFLGIHFKFNTRLETPYWQATRADTVLGPIQELIDYYQEQGPDPFYRSNMVHGNDIFGLEGYFTMLVGQKVPCRKRYTPTAEEKVLLDQLRERNRQEALRAFTVREALDIVMHPDCVWKPGFFNPPSESRLTSYIGSIR